MTNINTQEVIENLKIEIKLFKNEQVKAQATVDFGLFKLKGFVIRQKDGKNWVNPPSIPTHGKYLRVFFTEDKQLWNAIQEKILRLYDEKSVDVAIKDIDNRFA